MKMKADKKTTLFCTPLILLVALILQGCGQTAQAPSSVVATDSDETTNSFIASNISPAAFNEDTSSLITLSYTEPNNQSATNCALTNLVNVTVTQACACAAGVCTVGVKGSTDHSGSSSFKYYVSVGTNLSTSGTASLTITPVDDKPIAEAITPSAFAKNTQSIITLDYTDADSDNATACTLSNLSNVSITQGCACAAGVCTVGVTGTANYAGPASFNYTVTANGQTSDSATATLTITNAGNAPVANNISPASFNEDTQSIITLSYTDAESDTASACSVSNLSNVTVTQACACAAGVCTVGVTGTSNYSGSASFDYTVTANSQTSGLATASLTVTNVNDAPVAANITPASFNEDTQSVITLSYTDADSDTASTCTISGLTNVTVTQACACAAGVCTVGVTGTSGYSGSASFTYTVTANSQTSASATASLTIDSVNDAPVADALSPAAFNEDTQSVITLSYTDAESDSATACSLSNLSNVTVTQACACAAGVCTVGVTGTSDYNGAASFDYTITANSQTSAAATATLSISAVNDAPVADNISPAAFNEDTQSVITLSYTDAESDTASSCSIAGLTNVTVTQGCACAAGVCTVGVTGTSGYSGSASFTYTVTANSQTSASATASLTIGAVNDAPVADDITPASFNEDTQSIITLSYTDTETDQATSCSLSNLSNVTVTQACSCSSGTCTVGVTGTSNYNGAAGFDYTVTANGQTSASATATLSITSVDDAPVAINITPGAFDEDVATVVTLSYTDADFDSATSCTTSNLSNITVTSACSCALGTCQVTVKGTSNYNGVASFDYTVTANSQTSSAATASLTISAVDDAPVASNITPSDFPADTQSVITLSYTDTESHTATSCSLSGLTNVTITQACACTAGVCTVGVTGTSGYSGSAGFNYTVTANSLASNSASATLTITAVGGDSAPVANNITPASFNEDTQSIITLSYTDADSDQATSCSISSLSHVTVTQACACSGGTCTVGVTGTSGYYGSASFTYTVTANSATSNSATATLTIDSVAPAMRLVTLFPAQSLILASDAVVGETVSDVSSQYYRFYKSNGVTYSITSNTADNNFSITNDGIISVSSMTNLVAGSSYNITVKAEDSTLKLYDEKVMSIKVVSSADIIYIDPSYSGSRTGTRAKPQITWAQAIATWSAGKYLLQKRGTTATLASALNFAFPDNITMGAYGTGARPIMNFTATNASIGSGNGQVIRDLEIKALSITEGAGAYIWQSSSTNSNQLKILNSKIELPATVDLRINHNVQLLNNHIIAEIVVNAASTLYDIEIGFNYLTGTSRSVNISGKPKTVDVHHNIATPTNDTCITSNPTDQTPIISYRYNLCSYQGTSYPIASFSNTANPTSSTNDLEIVGNKFWGYISLLDIYKNKVKVHSNEFVMSTAEFYSCGLTLYTYARGEVFNNLFKTTNIYQSALCIGNKWVDVPLKVKNNIFDSVANATVYYYDTANANPPEESDYNLFTSDSLFSVLASDMTAWQTSGYDLNSVVGTPVYYDGANKDYHPLPTSPAVGMGTDLLLDFDIEEESYIPSEVHAGPYQMIK